MAWLENLKARNAKLAKFEGAEESIAKSEYSLLKITQPSFWNAHIEGNADVMTEIEGRKMLTSVADALNIKAQDVAQMPVLDVYVTMDYLEAKHKQ